MRDEVHGVSPNTPAACTTEAQTDEQDEEGKRKTPRTAVFHRCDILACEGQSAPYGKN